MPELVTGQPQLVDSIVRSQPYVYHARTGHVLQVGKSRVLEQLKETQKFSKANDMIINQKKTKLMSFNPCTGKALIPDFKLDDNDLEGLEEVSG